ncbi:RHS repeat protein [Streptomyces sp. CJ_13]|uniref:FG-GAP-like repeat-containing protein n=1 Tax=Streptomyces sp. CJ_13 TaxID=2724943 RepID=UPI001BDCBFE7|nr:FG-GAP-like repeat-containing protein [Streptomyces sp. CJ_13]MBT1187915.1 RHS repeat protein [Streptomyces sp. CJ_13]
MREFIRPKPPKLPASPAPKPDKPLKAGPAASPQTANSSRAAAAGVPNPDWVSAYATAFPATLSIGGQTKFSSVPASSVSGLWLYVMDEQKKPVLQQEIKRATDDPSGKYLENGAWCYGWWASNLYPVDQCFWWSSSLIDGHLKDGKKYYAWIFLMGADGSSSPGGTTSPLVEAFYTPDIPGTQAGLCTCYGQAYRADPVNTATGMFYDQSTDASLVGAGTPLSLDRTYRSDSTTVGLLGRGWATPFDSKLTVTVGSSATLLEGDGARVVFREQAGGSYATPAASALKLVKAGSSYTVTSPSHIRRTYNASGQLISITDRSGQSLTLTYASGRLVSVKDAAGRVIPFVLDAAGLLTKVSLPDGTSVSYGYTDGLLTSATDQAGKSAAYSYDANKRLATATGRGGGKVSNTYDASGRVTSQTDTTGKTTTFAWDNKRESHTTDRNGGVWTDVYSGNVLLESTDPYGKKVSYSYDRNLRPVSITDALGNTTEMTYDGAGRMTNRKAPSSTGLSERWTYDASGNITAHTDSLGKTSTYTYDSANRVGSSTDSAGGKVTYTYSPLGALAGVTSPRGKATTYTYDAAGNRVAVTTPLGEKTTFRYDVFGRVTAKTDPRGNATGADPNAFTTTYAYDARGLLATVTEPQGRSTTYGYDGAGRLTSVKDPAGRITTYGYDGAGRLAKITNPAGKAETRTYDANGNLGSVTDPLGNRTTHTYDKANRLLSTVSPRGNVSGANAASFTTSFAYDANGNQTTVTDPSGAVTTTAYDVLNRPVAVTNALGHTTRTTYDGNDNVLTTTDPLDKTTRYTYTDTGLTATSTDPLGKMTAFGYDADGHQISQTSPLGSKTTWTYDANGRVVTEVDPRGSATGANPAQFTTTYEYDPAGNQVKVTNPLGKVTTTQYDAANRVVAATDELGKTTKTDYDELGRIAKVIGPDGAVTSYTYNTVGDLATRVDPNGHTTTYGYDDARRQTSITDPLGRKKSVGYDLDGNQATVTNARGITATATLDARGLATAISYSDTTPQVSVTYDALGRRKTINDATGSRSLGYDAAGRLTSVTPSAGKGSYRYTYDDAGHLTSRTIDYTAPQPLDWSGTTHTVTGDLNGDGYTDIVRVDATNSIRTFLGRQDGNFDTGATLTGSGSGLQQILPVDYTGDGKLDLLAIDKTTGRLLRYDGDGKGSFASPVDLGPGWGPMTLTTGDFNKDGKPDFLAISSTANRLYLYPGNGAGGFGTRTDLGPGWAAYRINLIEFNGDGKLDILAINPSDGHLYLYPGDGAGNFGARKDLGAGWGAMRLVPGEFNNDGKPDFLAVDTANHKLRFYPGNGTGGFGAYVLQPDDWTPFDIPSVGRFDSSANQGVITADNAGKLRKWNGDGKGNLTGSALATGPAGGAEVTYGYDADGRRTSQTGGAGTISYGYDLGSRLTSTTLPTANGHIERRAYDNAGRLTSVTNAKGSAVLADWQITLDDTGRASRVAATRAGQAASYQYYTYDSAGRLLTDCTSTTQAGACPDLGGATTYTYDSVGNRKTQTRERATTTYAYDNADQLTTATTGATSRPYTYDADGNQTSDGTNTFVYDAKNQMTAVTAGPDTFTFTYDAEGNRTKAAKGTTALRTTSWDTNGPLPTIGAEYSPSGARTAEYQYNPLGQIQTETVGSSNYYLHHDQLGSVTDVTDSAGTATIRYSYTAFGEATRTDVAANPPANPFTYTGAYTEPTTSAAGYYLRARNYDPTTGRLTGTDPATLPTGRPAISPYAYANNAPTRYTDPTGWTPDDQGDGRVHSIGEAASVIGDGLVEGVKLPFQFVGDLFNAFTGRNGGAGSFVDKYLPVRPAYRLYRAAEMFRDQGCEALYDAYSDAAAELAGQVAVSGLMGLRGWQRDAVFPPAGGRYYGLPNETRFGLPYYTPDHPTSQKLINPEGGQMNCGLCAKAGDDLMAGRNPNSVPGADHPMTRPEVSALTGRPFVQKGGLNPVVADVLSWGPGARGIVGAWPQKGMGHYFNVANIDGKVVFFDFQQGRANPADPRYRSYYLMRTD